MPKVDLSTFAPPEKPKKELSCTLSDGQTVKFQIRQLRAINAIDLESWGKELQQKLESDPIFLGGELVTASETTCRIASTLAVCQVNRDDSEFYDERELLMLMTDDNFAVAAVEAMEWVASSLGDEGEPQAGE